MNVLVVVSVLKHARSIPSLWRVISLSFDEEWCIGCGVCVPVCPTTAAQLELRPDRVGHMPAPDFEKLHEEILQEKRLK